MEQRTTAFLCHSSKDKPLVRSVATYLRGSGIDVWIDEVELLPGMSLIERIGQAIHESDVILAFISSTSVSSSWVQKELSLAMTREIESKQIAVLPLLIETCDLPYFLRDKVYADLRDKTRFPQEIERVIRAITHISIGDALGSIHGVVPPNTEVKPGTVLGDVDVGKVIHNRGDSFQGFRIARTNKTVGVYVMVLGVAIALAALVVGLFHSNQLLTYFLLSSGAYTFVAAASLAVSGAFFEMAFDQDRNLLLEIEARGGYPLPFGRRWKELYKLSASNRYHRYGMLLETLSIVMLIASVLAIPVTLEFVL